MLNKEKLLLVPTGEEGIFLLTIKEFYTEGPIYAGFSKLGGFGNFEKRGRPEYVIKGTNGEYFDSEVLELTEADGYLMMLKFNDIHKPNESETTIYCHTEPQPGYPARSTAFMVDVNKKEAYAYADKTNIFNNLCGKTIRVYLGPSPTPLTGYL